jgi:uncharacterized repeat protein (TIGR01451 family)
LVLLFGGTNIQSQAAPQPPPASPPHAAEFNPESYRRLPDGIERPAIPNIQSIKPDTNLLPGSQIIFQALLDSSWEIFRSEPDGQWAQITNDSDDQIMARLNRGCSKIVLAGIPNKTYDIYTINPDGSGYTQLTYGGGDDFYPAWSPDGSLIAFQTYQNNDQADIYMMNADGSNATALAAYPDFYEGQPAWSPDGSQLAFTANYTGDYHIWVMNWDGSNLHELTTTHNSGLPQWSPDGLQIAYVADGDNEDWDEIWGVNSSGENPHEVYDPGADKINAWVGSWSPDGKGLIFSQIYWLEWGGNYYWYFSEIYLLSLVDNTISQIASMEVDWRPDWQACDIQPPVSLVNALPGESPADIKVSWAGYDNGAAGLRDFDVQVFDDAVGTWESLLTNTAETRAVYRGAAGHTYYFRSRARDNFYNTEAWPEYADTHTRVETSPPDSAVERLPPLSLNGVGVSWDGSDPGNSGIQSFDVQYRQADSPTWVDWFSATGGHAAPFTATLGSSYYFRARALDKAGNQEDWPAGAGDTYTTLYSMSLQGRVFDNSGSPVSEAWVDAFSGMFFNVVSDRNGNYAAYFAQDSAEPNRVTWSKDGYGVLPETNYDNDGDYLADVVLPPLENLVQNWDFEEYDITPEWQRGGNLLADNGGYNVHTGYYAIQLGPVQESRGPQTISTYSIDYPKPKIVSDSHDNLYIVWQDVDGVYFSQRAMNGTWSMRERIISSDVIDHLQLIKSQDNILHLAWDDGSDVFYMQHPYGGDWSESEVLPQTADPSMLNVLEVEEDGIVRIIWQDRGTNFNCEMLYSQRLGFKSWSDIEQIGSWTGSWDVPIAAVIEVDTQGIAHVLRDSAFYYKRGVDGNWSYVLQTCDYWCYEGDMAIDQSGTVHFSWGGGEGGDYKIGYGTLSPEGIWTTEFTHHKNFMDGPLMAVTTVGDVHLAWCEYSPDNEMLYAHKGSTGNWSTAEVIPGILCEHVPFDTMHFWLDEEETLYITGNYFTSNHLNKNGLWSEPTREYVNGDYYNVDVTMDSKHVMHYTMEWGPGNLNQIEYFGTAVMGESGTATISQAITIPLSMTAPTLSFMYDLWGQEFTQGSTFEVLVADAGITTTLFSTTSGTDGWTQGSFDLSAWAGEAITLTFRADRTSEVFGLSAFLDEVSIGPANPDVWVAASGDTHAQPGEQLTLELRYGNQGGALASGAVLSYTLPAGMSFVEADVPPTQVGSTLTWELGDLQAHSSSYSILVTIAIDGGVMPGEYQVSLLEISSQTAELETVNNTLEVRTYVGSLVMIPMLCK